MYNRDDNLCIVKSIKKLMDWARSPSSAIFKILHSVDMLVFKNTKWPTCVHMIKHITQTVVMFFNQDTMDENQRVDMIFCVHVVFPQGYGTHAQRSVWVVWLYYSLDSLHPFCRWITPLHALRPTVKSKRSN